MSKKGCESWQHAIKRIARELYEDEFKAKGLEHIERDISKLAKEYGWSEARSYWVEKELIKIYEEENKGE